MAQTSDRSDPAIEKFSYRLFAVTIVATLAVLFGALRFLAPGIWAAQWAGPLWRGVVAFLAISVVNCFIEFFFHRYILHSSAIPILRRLYRQHTLHHALTRIGRRQGQDGRGVMFIENKFPITEPEQGEASFFPWYSLGVFALAITPLLALLQWAWPAFPWLVGGYAALTSSLILYEVLHAINHWPFETWDPLISHPRWGWFWRPAYAFHLRHHAVIDCNESISGFFGLPLGDWAFGTCLMPKTIYADGEDWTPEKFVSPRPRWLIRRLDELARASVQNRRAQAAAPEPRAYTRGERIASWVTRGLGLGLSVAGLTLLIAFSSLWGSAWHVVSFTVFGLTLLALHVVSTLRQFQRSDRAKWLFGRLDRAALFLVIAGTYTPFLLTSLRGPWGWTLFGFIWGMAGAGAVFQFISGDRLRLTTILAGLFVGWSAAVALKPLLAAVPTGGIVLLLAGGLCYLAGLAFRRWRQVRYHQAIWHAFALGGGACHILAVILFLLPDAT